MGSGISVFRPEEDDAPPILDSYLHRSNFINPTETPLPGSSKYQFEEFITPDSTPFPMKSDGNAFMPEHFFQQNVTPLDSSMSLVYSYYDKTVKLGKIKSMSILDGL